MLLEVWKAVQLRLRAGRDFPIECITSALLVELYASRYPRCSCGGWRCSRCGGPIERGKHITVHTCRKPNRPVRWRGAAATALPPSPLTPLLPPPCLPLPHRNVISAKCSSCAAMGQGRHAA